MHPPITLKNPKHESFAQLLAQGYTPAFAYTEARFDSRNAKARAARLAKNPNIRARVKALKDALPRIQSLQARFAPSALLMPDTKDDMAALLWQVFSGIRTILPLQLRALTLLCRLKGWHIAPRGIAAKARRSRPIPGMPWPKEEEEGQPITTPPPSTPLTPEQQSLLTAFAQQVIAAMTDTLLLQDDPSDQTDQTDPSVQSVQSPPSAPTDPADPDDRHRRIQAIVAIVNRSRARHAAAAASTKNPPNIPISSTSQPTDSQSVNPKNAQTPENFTTTTPTPEEDQITYNKLLDSLNTYRGPSHSTTTTTPPPPKPITHPAPNPPTTTGAPPSPAPFAPTNRRASPFFNQQPSTARPTAARLPEGQAKRSQSLFINRQSLSQLPTFPFPSPAPLPTLTSCLPKNSNLSPPSRSWA